LGDVAVAPKLSATEGNGKILNYMAMGLPTVAFDTPVSREYLGDQGIYAMKGDAHSLARALLFSLSDPDSEARQAALRNSAVQAFGSERAAHIILSSYDRVCDGRRAVI
jgi:glycosyltransferase involved in cell wall biosynthesis